MILLLRGFGTHCVLLGVHNVWVILRYIECLCARIEIVCTCMRLRFFMTQSGLEMGRDVFK